MPSSPALSTPPAPPAPIHLAQFVHDVFTGAIGDCPLPFASQDDAVATIVTMLEARVRQPIAARDRTLVELEVACAWWADVERKALAEHKASGQRVLEEASAPVSLTVKPINMSVREAIKAIRDAARCDTCGKTRAVINLGAYTARAQVHGERVSLETHCACPGGPAHHLVQERAS